MHVSLSCFFQEMFFSLNSSSGFKLFELEMSKSKIRYDRLFY